MSMEKEGNEPIQEVAEVKQETEKEKPKQDVKPKRELTPQEIQRRKKMLVYPLFFLIFIGAMWLIFAPSKSKDKQLPDGFNSDLPVPKDEAIIADKRAAYEQESQRGKRRRKGVVCRILLLCSRRRKTAGKIQRLILPNLQMLMPTGNLP